MQSKQIISLVTAVLLFAACHQQGIDGFKQTDGGLYYKIVKENIGGKAIHVGDRVSGELVMKLDSTVILTNEGHPTHLATIKDSLFNGYDFETGLLLMREGERAVFAIPADTVAHHFPYNQLPKGYRPGAHMAFYFDITVSEVITAAEMDSIKSDEEEQIARYVATHGDKGDQRNGMYLFVDKKGYGRKIVPGCVVTLNYSAWLMDGTLFDCSSEALAREQGIYTESKSYHPLQFTYGDQGVIRGIEAGLRGAAAGAKITLVIPSKMAYGSEGFGDKVKPFSPVRYEIEVVSVQPAKQ